MSNNFEYELPSENTYTIYSKSGCPYCVKAKKLIEKEGIHIIDCDEYLIEDKEAFLIFIKNCANEGTPEIKSFPIIFYKKQFIGGYAELVKFYEKQTAFDYQI